VHHRQSLRMPCTAARLSISNPLHHRIPFHVMRACDAAGIFSQSWCRPRLEEGASAFKQGGSSGPQESGSSRTEG
jgi:hypothetical protein